MEKSVAHAAMGGGTGLAGQLGWPAMRVLTRSLALHSLQEHEKGTYGENSPGPVTAEMHSSIGRQTLSRKATKPSWGFGHAERKTVQVSNTPGPGAYWA